MRASAPRFTPLTEAQYDSLKAQVDPTYGAGYALYTELSRHRNAIGTDTDLSRTFAGHLTEANNSRLPFDQVLPSYTEYAAVVEEFLDADEPAPAPAPTPTSRRRAAAVPAPAPVVDVDDDGDPDDFDEDLDDEPIAPVYPAAARFTPPAPPSGEPTNADLMAVLMGIPPVLDDHATRIDEHSLDIEELFDRTGGRNGSRRSLLTTSRTSSGGGMLKTILAPLGVFIVTFLVTMAIVGLIGAISGFGPIAAIATWLWLIVLVGMVAAIIALVAALRNTRTNTASAVTREERS